MAVRTRVRSGRPEYPTLGVKSEVLDDLPTTEPTPGNPCQILDLVSHRYRCT